MTHRSKLFAFVSLIVLLIFCKIEVNRAAGTDTVYDFTGDKNIINPFPEVITPAEVEEFQRKTVSSRPFPWIEKNLLHGNRTGILSANLPRSEFDFVDKLL